VIRERESRGRGLVVVALAPVAIINNIYCILFNITILFNIVDNIAVLLVVALAPVAIYIDYWNSYAGAKCSGCNVS